MQLKFKFKGLECLDWPLMKNNITREDLDIVIDFLKQDDPILTQSQNVRALSKSGQIGWGASTAFW